VKNYINILDGRKKVIDSRFGLDPKKEKTRRSGRCGYVSEV
jgi:hypothetical protein